MLKKLTENLEKTKQQINSFIEKTEAKLESFDTNSRQQWEETKKDLELKSQAAEQELEYLKNTGENVGDEMLAGAHAAAEELKYRLKRAKIEISKL